MDLAKISFKLRASNTFFQDQIGFIGDLVLVDPDTIRMPTAYIVQGAISVTDNQSDTSVVQTLTDNFSIFTALSGQKPFIVGDPPTGYTDKDRSGWNAALGINIIREQFLDALIGLVVTENTWPIAYAGDNVHSVTRGTLWWQFNFFSRRIISAAAYEDPTLDDFDDALIQYVTPETVPPDTDPLPIPDPDFEDIVTTT